MDRSIFSLRNVFAPIVVLTIILASVACAGSAVSASTSKEPVVVITPQPMQIDAVPAIPETRVLTLDYPSKIRAGAEGDIVRLTLTVDDQGGLTPTVQIGGNTTAGKTVELPDLYETHNVTAEAQLDMVGMQVKPAGAIYEPLKRGQSATFYWSIRAQEPGKYPGTVWLHLNFSDKSTGENSRIAVSAQIIEIEAVDFFGLPINLVRVLGVIGLVIGGVIGYPFIEDIFRFLFKSRKKS